ncbi:hypothetical protein [Amycolatopsis jejuensis]|uniref:hypothetical protein n=1 Tax=Amycolatopsis jejuensis TaxID=330084 RepID=UPI000526E82B|nr:hypothetical protein [Amycolatopsis jejuensis]
MVVVAAPIDWWPASSAAAKEVREGEPGRTRATDRHLLADHAATVPQNKQCSSGIGSTMRVLQGFQIE